MSFRHTQKKTTYVRTNILRQIDQIATIHQKKRIKNIVEHTIEKQDKYERVHDRNLYRSQFKSAPSECIAS